MNPGTFVARDPLAMSARVAFNGIRSNGQTAHPAMVTRVVDAAKMTVNLTVFIDHVPQPMVFSSVPYGPPAPSADDRGYWWCWLDEVIDADKPAVMSEEFRSPTL